MDRCEDEVSGELAQTKGLSAAVWSWYAGLTKSQRIACSRQRGCWEIAVDGTALSVHRSFPLALQAAYVTSRALQALSRG